MSHISIRDLQKISGETIGALSGPTAVKSGNRTVGLLVPLKAADPDRLAAVLARAEALAKGCTRGRRCRACFVQRSRPRRLVDGGRARTHG